MDKPSFSDLLRRIGRTDKHTVHNYGPWYDLWFAPYRESAQHILEVGVCMFGGGSVLALAEYFPNAIIWAVDHDRSLCCPAVFDHPRVRFVQGDAYAASLPIRLCAPTFDIVIDDCLHGFDSQFALLRTLLPMLAADGLYVIEDVIAADWLPRFPDLWRLGLQQVMIDMTRPGPNPGQNDETLIKLQRMTTSKI